MTSRGPAPLGGGFPANAGPAPAGGRRRLEVSFSGDAGPDAAGSAPPLEHQIDVRMTLQRFRERFLPPKWRAVFDARFVAQQDQPAAARALGMRRTTLAYQEYRIRRLLRRFVLRGEPT